MSTVLLPALPHLPTGASSGAGYQRRRQPGSLIAIAAVHAALAWLLLQGDTVQRAVHQVTPLMVALLHTPAPQPQPEPALPAPPKQHLPMPVALPLPEVRVADAPPPPAATPAPAQAVALAAPTSLAPQAVAAVEPAPVRAVVAPPPAPPVLPASAIRYRVQPPVEVPLASRRLRESGTVLLRVLVDAQGLPKQITLHKSSGFARLDEQAMAAMRQARFQAVNDNGNAIEWVVIAPLQYDVD